jgi:hypothetical protein
VSTEVAEASPVRVGLQAYDVDTLATLGEERLAPALRLALRETKVWLADEMHGNDPTVVVAFWRWAVAVVKMTKRQELHLSRDVKLDIQEITRRAERAIGVIIRNGQADGTIMTPREVKEWAARRGVDVRKYGKQHPAVRKPIPSDYIHNDVMHGTGSTYGIRVLIDNVSDEMFEATLVECRQNRNMSRSTMAKVLLDAIPTPPGVTKAGKNKASTEFRERRVRQLAEERNTAAQIAEIMGLSVEGVRNIAKRIGVQTVDAFLGKGRRELDHDKLLREAVTTLEGTVLALDMLDLSRVEDLTEIESRRTSLGESIRAFTRVHKKLKEMEHDTER